jgi:CubicO group peptidase (beta-lactamase class C family)
MPWFFGCGSSDSSSDSLEIKSIEDIPAVMASHNVPGVSIVTIKNFEIDQVIFYGVKNQNTGEFVGEETVFQAGSISKSLAAVAALAVNQNGVISLDEDINTYLSSWQVGDSAYTLEQKVTARRLLSHTAGTSVHGFAGYAQNSEQPTLLQVLNGVSPANSEKVVVNQTPGSGYKYSGGGYTIVQQALIDVTAMPFEQLMDELVLTPLSMTSSTVNQSLSDEYASKASAAHDPQGKVIPGGYHIYPEMAAAGLWATPKDLARFLIELQLSISGDSNIVLSKDSTDTSLTPVSNKGYGLGFQIYIKGGEEYFGHGGVNKGFNAMMIAHKSKGVGIVVMTNSSNGFDIIDSIILLFATSNQWPGY